MLLLLFSRISNDVFLFRIYFLFSDHKVGFSRYDSGGKNRSHVRCFHSERVFAIKIHRVSNSKILKKRLDIRFLNTINWWKEGKMKKIKDTVIKSCDGRVKLLDSWFGKLEIKDKRT